jgi:hypothetical protein
MKKILFNVTASVCLMGMMMLSSCYTYTMTMGNGPQTGVTETGKNHHLIFGLVDLKQSDAFEMAGDAENYRIVHEHTFVDGLLNAITFGIYNPTTTKVEK